MYHRYIYYIYYSLFLLTRPLTLLTPGSTHVGVWLAGRLDHCTPWQPLFTHLSSWAEAHRQRGLCRKQRLALSSGIWEPLGSSEWKGHVIALCLLTRSFWMLGADEQGRQQEGHFANWLTAGVQAGNSTTRKWEIVSSETWSGAKSVKFDKSLHSSPEKKWS